MVVANFGRVISILEGGAKLQNPVMMLNFRVTGSKLRFRYGYAGLAVTPITPGDTFACLGLDFVKSQSGDEEFLSVENRDGTRGVYSINPATFARSLITGSDQIEQGNWGATSFYDNAYLFTSTDGVLKRVWRHVIGDNTSFTALQNVAYNPPEDPDVTINFGTPGSVSLFDAGDAFVYASSATYPNGTVVDSFSAEGSLILEGPSSDTSAFGGYFEVEQTFASARDISGADYYALSIEAGPYLRYFTQTTVLPQLKIGGSWVDVTDAKFFFDGDDVGQSNFGNTPARTGCWVLYLRGLVLTAVQGLKFRFNCKPNRGGTVPADFVFATIGALQKGGYYLEQETSGQRLWDSTLVGDGITYGLRFSDGAVTQSAIFSRRIAATSAQGYFPETFACPLGGIVRLESDEPQTPYDRTEFLRLDESVDPPEWKLIGTVTSAPFYFQDSKIESEIPALPPEATGTGTPATPVFTVDNIVFAFPYKTFMIWLLGVGASNIQMSRVGDAEELYTSERTYDPADETRPGQRTMADGADDIPVWGTQAGQVAIVVGQRAAYSLYGDFPDGGDSPMSPSRQIPGSRGIAGMYAGTRFRPSGGGYGACYADSNLNIWVVGSIPQFDGDASAKPFELSEAVRGQIYQTLFTEQKLLNPALSVADTHLEFQEETSSLWVILGNRAAVYRQDEAGNGWEFYAYSLTTPEGSSEEQTCTSYSGNGGSATSVAPGDDAWSNLGNPFSADDAYSEATLGFGTLQSTETLRIAGLVPSILLPVSATLDSLTIRVERSKTGDLDVTEIDVQPKNGAATLGTDRSTNYVLTDSDVSEVFTPSALPTVAELNAGNLGLDLKYQQETWLTDWNNPAYWNIGISGGGTGAAMTVTATYTGPGSPPSKVFVNITSEGILTVTATGDSQSLTFSAEGTINNGFETSDVYMDENGSQSSFESTEKVVIALTAGTGSTVVTRLASGSMTSGTGWTVVASYTGSAALVSPTPATVKVDAVEFACCFTVEEAVGAPEWVGWDKVCFTPENILLAIRTTGEIDAIEKDPRNNSFISGSSRDGGYAPLAAYFETQVMTFEGRTAAPRGLQLNTLGGEDWGGYAKTSDDYVAGFEVGAGRSLWKRFVHMDQSPRLQFKFTMEETDGGIEGFFAQIDIRSKAKFI